MTEAQEARTAEIYVLLAQLDLKALRPLREADTVRLADLATQSDALRTELAALLALG